MVRWNEVTALFGGTFDPPHLGHREAVLGLFRNPGIGRVLVLPAASPPHKPASVSAEHRVAMAERCFRATFTDPYPADVTLDLRELARAKTTGRPSYSFDTIQEIRRELPKLAFVIGTDQLRDLPRWHRFPELLDLCHWIVLARKPEGADAREALALDPSTQTALRELEASGLLRPGQESLSWISRGNQVLRLVTTDAPGFSSTRIRESLGRTGSAPEGSLFPDVLSYLKEHRLYGTQVELQ